MYTILRFPRYNTLASRASVDETHLYDRFNISVKVADANIHTEKEVADLIEFWHPDGCIVNNDKLPESAFAKLPTVFLHRNINPVNPRHASLKLNEKAIAQVAARHLLSLDLATYAFVPPSNAEIWSLQREQHFVHILGLNGHGVAVYAHPARRFSSPKRIRHLASWLKSLPRPIGIFAANDSVAAEICAACDHLHLSIPNDIALLGADNDETICETLRPTLSSISVDIYSARYETARLIHQLISKRKLKHRNLTIAPDGVVRRASTLCAKKTDSAVVAAYELIRRRACDGLKARDVTALFPCGRRMAEIRFRAMIGHSILNEIRAVRRAHALAATSPRRSRTREEIAADCGYKSWSSVLRLLKP